LLNSEQDISFISFNKFDIWINIISHVVCVELSKVLKLIILLTFSLLNLVLLYQLSKWNLPINIRSINHLFIFILWRQVRSSFYAWRTLGASNSWDFDRKSTATSNGLFKEYEQKNECTSTNVQDHM